MRIGLDKDLDGWRPEKGKTDKYGNDIEDREYNERDFDRNLILEKRTELVAAKITEFLKATDRFAKTIVFCENIDHAERMRQALVNANADLAAANKQLRHAHHRRQRRGQGPARQLHRSRSPPSRSSPPPRS